MERSPSSPAAPGAWAEYRRCCVRRTGHGLREFAALGEPVTEADIATLQGRMCEPEEVARAALFLASPQSSFNNGEILVVDNAALAAT